VTTGVLEAGGASSRGVTADASLATTGCASALSQFGVGLQSRLVTAPVAPGSRGGGSRDPVPAVLS